MFGTKAATSQPGEEHYIYDDSDTARWLVHVTCDMLGLRQGLAHVFMLHVITWFSPPGSAARKSTRGSSRHFSSGVGGPEF